MIKLISKGSIDECILQLGQKKLKLEHDMTAAEQGKQMHTQRKMLLFKKNGRIIVLTCDSEWALRVCDSESLHQDEKNLPASSLNIQLLC